MEKALRLPFGHRRLKQELKQVLNENRQRPLSRYLAMNEQQRLVVRHMSNCMVNVTHRRRVCIAANEYKGDDGRSFLLVGDNTVPRIPRTPAQYHQGPPQPGAALIWNGAPALYAHDRKNDMTSMRLPRAPMIPTDAQYTACHHTTTATHASYQHLGEAGKFSAPLIVRAGQGLVSIVALRRKSA